MGHELFLTNIRKIILGINLIYLFSISLIQNIIELLHYRYEKKFMCKLDNKNIKP